MSQSHFLNMEELPEDQDWLIDRMQKLGYRSNKGGICFGETLMWAQARTMGKVEAYNKRLLLLNSLSLSDLKMLQNKHKRSIERIKPILEMLRIQAKKKVIENLGLTDHKKLSIQEITQLNKMIDLENEKIQVIRQGLLTEKELEDEGIISDIEAYFHGIEVFLQGHQYYTELYNQAKDGIPLAQHAERTSEIVKSKLMQNFAMVEVTKDSEFSRPYAKPDLIHYFQTLRTLIENKHITYPMSLVLGGGGHTIGVSYDLEKHAWLFNNASKLSDNIFYTDEDIADRVLKALSDNEYAVFATEVYMSSEYRSQIQPYLTDWIEQIQLKDYTKQRCADSHGTTWLHVAADKGHLNKVRQILQSNDKSIVNQQRNDNKWTALHCAVMQGRLQVVEHLLNAEKIEPELTSSMKETPLHIAALQKNHGEIMKALLKKIVEKNGNVNAKDESGDTALHTTVCQNDFIATQLLLNTDGILVNEKRRDGKSALHIAAFNGNVDMVRRLLSHKDIEPHINDFDNETPLYQAARQGHFEIVTLILNKLNENHHNIDVQRKDGETALYIAARQGHLAILHLMLSGPHKVNPDVQRKDGKTALHIAALQGHTPTVKLLLKYANPTLADKEGNTPLHIAVRSLNIEMVILLLATNKCDPHTKNLNGESAISTAMHYNRHDILQVLLDKAKPDVTAIKFAFNWRITQGLTNFFSTGKDQNKVSPLQSVPKRSPSA